MTIENNDESDISFDEDSSGSAEEKIKKLKDKLNAVLKEKEEYLSGWQRCRADFVNAKRMADVDRLSILDSAGESFVKDILPVLDSFDLALANMKAIDGESPDASVGTGWRAGFVGIYSKMIEILGRKGLKQIGQVGDKFDINLQEPVAMIPVDSEEQDDIVTDVLQRGYTMNGRVIRPAKVTVGQFNKS